MFWQVPLAYLADIIIGDPDFIIHPVVIIGKGISFMENRLMKMTNSSIGLKLLGVLLTTIIVGSSWLITYFALKILLGLNFWLYIITAVWLISTTIAGKSLKKAALEIFHLLKSNDIMAARQKVGWIVGRDTENLDAKEIIRATVETVAENIVDGITAPLFYAFIGGAPLAIAYRATNTLDSMVGYKNEKYKDFGWAAARFDDILNFIPARITAILIVIGITFLKFPVKRTVKAILRDAPEHPSPNSGYPESAVAGALGIQLGGLNFYGGQSSFRAHMGENIVPLDAEHIIMANRIVDMTGLLAVITGTGLWFWLQ